MSKRTTMRAGCLLLAWLLAGAGPPPRSSDAAYHPSLRTDDGVELGFVYIGGTGCGYCRDARLKEAVRKAKELLHERAMREKRPFAATGVALDWTLESGERFLADVGPFDQVVIGRNEFNLGILTFVAHDAGAMPLMPQIVVYEQDVRHSSTRVVAGRLRILARYVGAEIPRWVSEGAKLEAE